ncbi:MAG: dTDP-4-dehydrorhamnose reductase [Actinomycetota bacterium]
MRVLITGAKGQLGTDLLDAFGGRLPVAGSEAFAGEHLVSTHEVLGCDLEDFSLTDANATMEFVTAYAPDLIVHGAAYTAVDKAEAELERAMAVNRDGTANVVAAARAVRAKVLAISTDYVFDGSGTRPYLPSDATNPISAYGITKLAGELACGEETTIVRTSWVAGYHGANIVKTILRLANEGTAMTFVDDQFGCPTLSSDLAVALLRLSEKPTGGILHATNFGPTSWYALAKRVVTTAGFDPDLVSPIATADRLPAPPARRPMYSVLDGEALIAAGVGPLPPWEESLDRLVRLLVA